MRKVPGAGSKVANCLILHGRRFQTIRQAKDETLAWLLWYNQTRMHSTLGYLSPIQFEQQWHRTTHAIAS